MAHELQRLQRQHLQIIDLCVAGLDNHAIAAQLDRNAVSIGLILNSPLAQSELARRREKLESHIDADISNSVTRARTLIDNAAFKAAEKQIELLTDESPRIQHVAAKDILDRAMGRSQDRESKAPTIVIDAETINLLQVANIESQKTVKVVIAEDAKE